MTTIPQMTTNPLLTQMTHKYKNRDSFVCHNPAEQQSSLPRSTPRITTPITAVTVMMTATITKSAKMTVMTVMTVKSRMIGMGQAYDGRNAHDGDINNGRGRSRP
jgi:hypothetical protein